MTCTQGEQIGLPVQPRAPPRRSQHLCSFCIRIDSSHLVHTIATVDLVFTRHIAKTRILASVVIHRQDVFFGTLKCHCSHHGGRRNMNSDTGTSERASLLSHWELGGRTRTNLSFRARKCNARKRRACPGCPSGGWVEPASFSTQSPLFKRNSVAFAGMSCPWPRMKLCTVDSVMI